MSDFFQQNTTDFNNLDSMQAFNPAFSEEAIRQLKTGRYRPSEAWDETTRRFHDMQYAESMDRLTQENLRRDNRFVDVNGQWFKAGQTSGAPVYMNGQYAEQQRALHDTIDNANKHYGLARIDLENGAKIGELMKQGKTAEADALRNSMGGQWSKYAEWERQSNPETRTEEVTGLWGHLKDFGRTYLSESRKMWNNILHRGNTDDEKNRAAWGRFGDALNPEFDVDRPLQTAEQMAAEGKKGALETLENTLIRDRGAGIAPFFRSFGIKENYVENAARRQGAGYQMYLTMAKGDESKARLAYDNDKKLLNLYANERMQEARGTTGWATATDVTLQSLMYGLEFAATGAAGETLAHLNGVRGLTAAALKGSQALKHAGYFGKIGAKTAEMIGGTLWRMPSMVMPMTYGMTQQQKLDNGLKQDAAGNWSFQESAQPLDMELDNFIMSASEVASEMSGGIIGAAVPVGKIASKIPGAAMAKRIADRFAGTKFMRPISKVMNAMHWDGLPEEVLEETANNFACYLTGVETTGAKDPEDLLDRMKAFAEREPENMVENFKNFMMMPVVMVMGNGMLTMAARARYNHKAKQLADTLERNITDNAGMRDDRGEMRSAEPQGQEMPTANMNDETGNMKSAETGIPDAVNGAEMQMNEPMQNVPEQGDRNLADLPVNVPEENPAVDTITPQTEESIQQIEERLNREMLRHKSDEEIKNYQPLKIRTEGLNPQQLGAANLMKHLFGRNVYFFEGNEGADGFTSKHDNNIYLNNSLKNPLAFTMFHEFYHKIEGTEAGKEIMDAVLQYADQHKRAEHGIRYNAGMMKNGFKPVDQQQLDEEFVSDVIGGFGSDEKFLKQLASERPGVIEQFLEWIDNLIANITGAVHRGEIAQDSLKDVERVRNRVQTILKKEIRRNARAEDAKAGQSQASSDAMSESFMLDARSEETANGEEKNGLETDSNGLKTDNADVSDNNVKMEEQKPVVKENLTTEKDNVYLRMPIERVRQDAENGVKLAQDALKIREGQEAQQVKGDEGQAQTDLKQSENGQEQQVTGKLDSGMRDDRGERKEAEPEQKAEADGKDQYDKIRNAKTFASRIKAFLDLPDGEHNLDGFSFSKENGNAFRFDGKYLGDNFSGGMAVYNARDLLKAYHEFQMKKVDVSKKESTTKEIDAGRLNQESETPLLSDKEDQNDFKLVDETPEEARKRDEAKARQEKEAIDRANEESKNASPDLFSHDARGEMKDEKSDWKKFGKRVFWDKGLPFRIVKGYTVGQMIEYCQDQINALKSKGKESTKEYADLEKEVSILKNLPQKDVDVYDNYVKGYWTEDDRRTFAEYEKRKNNISGIIEKTVPGTKGRIEALSNLADGKYHAFGLTFEKKTEKNPDNADEISFICDGKQYSISQFEEEISKAEGKESFKRQYNPDKEPREITSSTYTRAQKSLERQASGVVTGKNVPAGPDITNTATEKDPERFAAYLEERQKAGVLKATRNDIASIKKFYEAFPLHKKIVNKWGEEISFEPQDAEKVDDYIQHFAVKRGGGLEKFSESFSTLFNSLEDALKNPDERILTENENGNRRICFTKRIEENGNHFVVTAISENGHLLAWTHMNSTDAYIEKQRQNEKNAVEKYGVVNREGVKQNLTYEEYLKVKEDMPLYLATAQTNRNLTPQAEHSDGKDIIPHSGEKTSTETKKIEEKFKEKIEDYGEKITSRPSLHDYVKGSVELEGLNGEAEEDVELSPADDNKYEIGNMKYEIEETGRESRDEKNEELAEESTIKFSPVTDPEKIKELDAAEYITTYRAAQLQDGKLYSPMAGKINGKWGAEIELGKWEQTDEHPELAKAVLDKNTGKQKTYGKKEDEGYGNPAFEFTLNKGNGSSITAKYNPYFHSSTTPLNDQFAEAYQRPELVTLEVRVPKSELTSRYHAEKAKNSVGMKKWKAGVVQTKLDGYREVMLSRWDKPIRIVPDSEVAQKIKEMLEGKNVFIPANVVTPQLRAELKKIGVKITGEPEIEKKLARQKNKRTRNGLVTDLNGEIKLSPADMYITEVNEKYNQELQKQIEGTLEEGHIYQIGRPSPILLSTGIPNLPIELSAKRLYEKANHEGHPFNMKDVKDLPRIMQNPIGIFAYGNKTKAQNILVEVQKDGKNFIVGLSLNYDRNGLIVNSIRGLFPKETHGWLSWIQNGKSLYLNKEKIQNLINQQRTNFADVEYLDLDSISNIIQNFQNPSVETEKNEKNSIELSPSEGERNFVRDMNELNNKSFKQFWNGMRRNDLNPVDSVFATPNFSYDKIPALLEVRRAAERMSENSSMLNNWVMNGDTGRYILAEIHEWEKQNPAEYNKFGEYLRQKDIDRNGYTVTEEKDDKGKTEYVVREPARKHIVAHFDSEKAAWEDAWSREKDDLLRAGESEQFADYVYQTRKMLGRLYDELNRVSENARQYYEENDMQMPMTEDNISLWDAVRQMGDLRGSYFPRTRTGDKMLYAEKDGENPRLEMFDTAVMRNLRAEKLKSQGWKVEIGISKTPAPEVFSASNIAAMNDLFQSAMQKVRNEDRKFSDFGMVTEKTDYTNKKGEVEKHLRIRMKDGSDINSIVK